MGCGFFCSVGPLATVRSTWSFLLVVSAGSPGSSWEQLYVLLFLSPFFLYSGRNCIGALPLPPVISLRYSNIFPILKRSQMFVNCSWVTTRTYRLKNIKVVCSNGSHVSQSLFFVPVFTLGHNFPYVVSLDPTRRVRAVKYTLSYSRDLFSSILRYFLFLYYFTLKY